jgi:hypothetical protein
MAKAMEDQPEFHIAKSFSVMTILQPRCDFIWSVLSLCASFWFMTVFAFWLTHQQFHQNGMQAVPLS